MQVGSQDEEEQDRAQKMEQRGGWRRTGSVGS